MLDYKDIITKHYALGMSGTKIAEPLKGSKSGGTDFLKAFRECPVLSYPLPEGITNYGIAELVYGKRSGFFISEPNLAKIILKDTPTEIVNPSSNLIISLISFATLSGEP